MTTTSRQRNATFNSDILIPAIWQSVIKLDPRWMWRNPVMFVVEIGAVLTLILTISPTFFGGAVAEIPAEIGSQLADGGRLVAVVNPGSGMGRATLLWRIDGSLTRRILFDAATPLLPGFLPKPVFAF